MFIFIIRILLLNYLAKVFYSCYTYTIYLAEATSTTCLDLTNFPWYHLYLLSNRIALIAEISTFLCMSMAKVILNWRLDIYVNLNSNFTVNLATIVVIAMNLTDFCIRAKMHMFDDCADKLAEKMYQVELHRSFCIPETYENTNNATICEIYEETKSLYPIGCQECHSYPTLRILLSAVLLLESIKFVLGCIRIAEKYRKKFKKHKTVNPKSQQIIVNRNMSKSSLTCATISSMNVPLNDERVDMDKAGVSNPDIILDSTDIKNLSENEIQVITVEADIHQRSSTPKTKQSQHKSLTGNNIEHQTSSRPSEKITVQDNIIPFPAQDITADTEHKSLAEELKFDQVETLGKTWNDEFAIKVQKLRFSFYL